MLQTVMVIGCVFIVPGRFKIKVPSSSPPRYCSLLYTA